VHRDEATRYQGEHARTVGLNVRIRPKDYV